MSSAQSQLKLCEESSTQLEIPLNDRRQAPKKNPVRLSPELASAVIVMLDRQLEELGDLRNWIALAHLTDERTDG